MLWLGRLLSRRFYFRGISWPSVLAAGLLVATCIALLSYQGSLAGSGSNTRREFQERLGSQIDGSRSDVAVRANNRIILGTFKSGTTAAADWPMLDYEFAHVLSHTQTCALSVYVIGTLTGADSRAGALIRLNGQPIARVAFGSISPDYPIENGRLAPTAITPAIIPMTPLFEPYGYVFPVASTYCRARDWHIGIDVRGARWTIERVGVIATFTPSPEALAPNGATLVLAFVIIAGLLIGTQLLFEAVTRAYGPIVLSLTLVVFVCAFLTHDEWDFPIWMRFVDLVAFGHGNPAAMWGGSPLWPLGVALLAPVLSASSALSGDASQQVTALFLKWAMALAACANAYVLARFARPMLRRFLFPILLLSPYALYELAGGYREIFAGSFFLIGASLALRGRYSSAALVLCAATSITESLAPLIVLPAALRLVGWRVDRRLIALALRDVFAGVAPLVMQWLFLVPHSFVATTLSTRVSEAYRFGGGSWLATLDGFGLLPPWVGQHSTLFVLGLYALLASPLAFLIVRAIFSTSRPGDVRRVEIIRMFLGLVVAFFLAYRGVDPSTWYALSTVVAFYFIRFEEPGLYPFFLSVMQAVAFYAILGLGDYANSTYVMPQNQSLLGVLGKPMLVSVLAVNLAIFALYVSCVRQNFAHLFGRGSTRYLLLFLGATATAAIRMYAVDIVFCFAAGALILIAFARFSRIDACRQAYRRSKLLDFLGLASVIVVGACAGTQNGAAALVAFIALLLGLTYGFAMCDIVLATCGTLILGTQYGFGWVSIAGYIVLSLLAVEAICTARAVSIVDTRASGAVPSLREPL